MRASKFTVSVMGVAAALAFAGCAKKNETPVDKAIDGTKDALDMRDHEKLRDAAEDTQKAAKDVGKDIKDGAKETAADVKDAAKDNK